MSGEGSSVALGPYSRSRVIGSVPKGRSRERLDHKRRKIGETCGRKVFRRASNGRKEYRDRKPRSTKRTDVNQPVESTVGDLTRVLPNH